MWFGVVFAIGLWLLDGNMQAVADRLTHQAGEPEAAAKAPGFTPAPTVVADAADDEPKAGLPAVGGRGDRARGSALEDTCIEGTPDACKRWAMDGFYRALVAEAGNKLGRAVRVSWYGDSVVATDAIPGRLRSRLQSEIGDGGPGFVYVIPPHRFCAHEGISRSHGGTWATHAISTQQIADGLYGAGGATAETDGGKATIKLVAGKATQVELHYLTQARGGSVSVKADGADVLTVDTKAEAKTGMVAKASIADGAAQFVVQTTGRVRIFGLDLENGSGAVVDNFGIVSVNAKSFGHHNASHYAAELVHRSSDLIIVMIGANEAVWLHPGDRATKEYQVNYEKVLAPIRKARPDATCLVVSPTDQAEAKDGGYPSKPVMPLLVDAQRKAAHASGCAFFSTYDWMGAKGSAAKWFRKGFVGSDFIHLSRKGANKLADAVYDALMGGYRQHAVH
ncbi:MAG: putative periplasmic protein [Myxococcales bacterium]|nr:putative periplasmic protein [Myxococcales bacterium]